MSAEPTNEAPSVPTTDDASARPEKISREVWFTFILFAVFVVGLSGCVLTLFSP